MEMRDLSMMTEGAILPRQSEKRVAQACLTDRWFIALNTGHNLLVGHRQFHFLMQHQASFRRRLQLSSG